MWDRLCYSFRPEAFRPAPQAVSLLRAIDRHHQAPQHAYFLGDFANVRPVRLNVIFREDKQSNTFNLTRLCALKHSFEQRDNAFPAFVGRRWQNLDRCAHLPRRAFAAFCSRPSPDPAPAVITPPPLARLVRPPCFAITGWPVSPDSTPPPKSRFTRPPRL